LCVLVPRRKFLRLPLRDSLKRLRIVNPFQEEEEERWDTKKEDVRHFGVSGTNENKEYICPGDCVKSLQRYVARSMRLCMLSVWKEEDIYFACEESRHNTGPPGGLTPPCPPRLRLRESLPLGGPLRLRETRQETL